MLFKIKTAFEMKHANFIVITIAATTNISHGLNIALRSNLVGKK